MSGFSDTASPRPEIRACQSYRHRVFAEFMPDAALVEPSQSRRQHSRIERVEGRNLIDADGNVAAPFRSVDTLALMLRRGTISVAMWQAGEAFRDSFAQAQLEPLRAADVSRIPGCGMAPPLGSRVEAARLSVWQSLLRVGGLASPAGSCLWHVLGEGQSLAVWAALHGCGAKFASGVLAAALGAIAEPQKNRRATRFCS